MHADEFHLGHHARQRRLGRRSSQHDEQLFLDVLQVLKDAESVEPCHQPEDEEDEDQACRIEAGHQLAELEERPQPILADGKSHGAEGSNRCHPHDDADDAEQDGGDLLDHRVNHPAFIANHVQRKAEQDREEQDRQDVAFGEGSHNRVGDDVQQKTAWSSAFCPVRCRRPRTSCPASAGSRSSPRRDARHQRSPDR